MIKYRGGKSKEIPNIIKHIPYFEGRYVEPFFGGGALYFYLEPKSAIINDINTKLISFYKGVRDDYQIVSKELKEIEIQYASNRNDFDGLKLLHPTERVEDKNENLYYQLRAMYNDISEKQYTDAALYYYINKTAYSGMIRFNSKGEFNVPFGRYKSLNTNSISLSHSQLLQTAQIFNTDYSEIFRLCHKDDFVFLDPPYDCIFSDYGNEEYKDGFDEHSHRKLAQDFANLPCKALMVIGKTPLTEELYKGYIIDEYQKNYSVNIRNRFKAAATHIVVANYIKRWEASCNSYNEQDYTQLCLFDATRPYYGKDK